MQTSKDSFLMKGALFSCMYCPILVEPVNEISLIRGWSTIAEPVMGPVPNVMFTTPGGRPRVRKE